MVQTEYRSAADIDFARGVGNSFGPALSELTDFMNFFGRRTRANKLLRDVERAVRSYGGTAESQIAPGHSSKLTWTYRTDVENFLRLLWLEKALDLGGMPVLRDSSDEILGTTTVDLLNPLALSRLSIQSDAGNFRISEAIPARTNSSVWRRSVKQLIEMSNAVRRVDRTTVARGFVSLLADAMRALYRGYSQLGKVDTMFTVHSGHGYQIRVYETLRYSPVVFGGNNSSPVTARLRFGHYRFEGIKGGALVSDSGTYPVSLYDTSATMADF
jgi:hypothetical protein